MLTAFRHQRAGSVARRLLLVALVGLSGCSANAGAGFLQGAVSAAQSGGSLTPITNLGNAITLQELANSHNTIYEAQQILNATGPVSITTTPSAVVSAPSPVAPVTNAPTTPAQPTGTPLPTAPTPNG